MTYSLKAALGVAVLAIATSIALPASAQTLRLNLQQLEETSDEVIIGRTVRAESAWAPDDSAILTRVTIQVEDPVTGANLGEQVVLVPGGQVGEYLHEISDMPTFRVDEEVAVFLTRHTSGEMIVTGGWQGKLDVVEDPETGDRQVLGASYLLDADVKGFANKAEATENDAVRSAMTVGDFARRVRKLKREK